MVVSVFELDAANAGWWAAAAVLARAAGSLFVHGLVGLGRPAAISRRTGSVSRR